MAKKKVFVSFDYEKNRNYKFLLQAWNSNENFEFSFDDLSSGEIDSDDVGVVKQVLSRKINSANYTLVIVGSDANKLHKDREKIGYINWQNYECVKSLEHKNKVAVVKLDSSYSIPKELTGHRFSIANEFEQDKIIQALSKA